MARRAIREFDAKRLLARYLPDYLPGFTYPGKVALVTPESDWNALVASHSWLATERLVVKPDQLFGKRGKLGLLGLDLDAASAKAWLDRHMGQQVTLGKVTDQLSTFLIEPFVPHEQRDEKFVAIRTERAHDVLYYSPQGGIDIEENWDTVTQVRVPVLAEMDDAAVAPQLPDSPERDRIARFIAALHRFFVDLDFAYLEINPFVLVQSDHERQIQVVPLDFVAKIDDTAAYRSEHKWGELVFPPPFGTHKLPEEEYIHSLDGKTGASLKLRVLNPKGRVWPMIAGGGASVIYADTVADLGFADELACYGEYSGNPSTELTLEYARTMLGLMTREPDPQGRPKFLLIGGGIANFTDVAKTFTGIAQALREYRDRLRQNDVRIYVRRGGPNYQEGLAMMRRLGEELGIPVEVHGPGAHMTSIVSTALAE